MSAERKHREEIVRYGRMPPWSAGLCGDGRKFVGPAGQRANSGDAHVHQQGAMRAGDMVIVDLEGERVAGRRNVTSEIGMQPADLPLAARHNGDCARASADRDRVRGRGYAADGNPWCAKW